MSLWIANREGWAMWRYIHHHGYEDHLIPIQKTEYLPNNVGIIYSIPTSYRKIVVDGINYCMSQNQFGFHITANKVPWKYEYGAPPTRLDEDLSDKKIWADLDGIPEVFHPILSKAIPYYIKSSNRTAEDCSFLRFPLKIIRK